MESFYEQGSFWTGKLNYTINFITAIIIPKKLFLLLTTLCTKINLWKFKKLIN